MPAAKAAQSLGGFLILDLRFSIGSRFRLAVRGMQVLAVIKRIKNQKSKVKNDIDLKDEGLRFLFQISDLKFEISDFEISKTRPVNFSVCS